VDFVVPATQLKIANTNPPLRTLFHLHSGCASHPEGNPAPERLITGDAGKSFVRVAKRLGQVVVGLIARSIKRTNAAVPYNLVSACTFP
jgi:hypothetical protein